MTQNFLKNPKVQIALQIIALPVIGFILLNLAFILDYLFQTLIDFIVGFFVSVDLNVAFGSYFVIKQVLFLLFIFLISYFIFKSHLPTIAKAIYSVVPLAATFLTIGILSYPFMVISYVASAFVFVSLVYYLYTTKQPWQYYYAVLFIGVLMLMIAIFSIDI